MTGYNEILVIVFNILTIKTPSKFAADDILKVIL